MNELNSNIETRTPTPTRTRTRPTKSEEIHINDDGTIEVQYIFTFIEEVERLNGQKGEK